jgi:hypothetical protein
MTNRALLTLLSGFATTSLLVGCGSSEAVSPAVEAPQPTDPAAGTAPAPAPAAPPLDHGAPSATYPAFVPAVGQLQRNGGPTLKNPVFVTVTWQGDPNVNELETLGDTVGAGQYWKDLVSEYGVGPAVSGEANHVHVTDAAPTSISDTALKAFVAASLTKTEGAWPTPAGDVVYILYLPQTTDLLLQGKSACSQGVGGYHDSTSVNGKPTAFAIVPRCGSGNLDHVTVSASHELAEAATDPYPQTRPGLFGFREEDLAWEFFQQFQSENGDACEFYRDSDLLPSETDVGFAVQRQWSNASGKAGHDPCVPRLKDATYFNVTPLDLEDVGVDLSAVGGSTATAKGFKVKVGETRQVPLGFYSDGPIGEWTIKAVNGGIAGGRSSGGLDLTLDVTSGQNGQKAYLTVTVNTAGKTGAELVTIVSSRAGTSHYMPLLIGSAK